MLRESTIGVVVIVSCLQVKNLVLQSSKTCLFVPPIYQFGQFFRTRILTSVVVFHIFGKTSKVVSKTKSQRSQDLNENNLQKLKIGHGHGRSHRP